MQAQLIHFLQKDLKIPADSVAIALRQCELTPHQLPMILWQYGLITLEQLEKIFDWLEMEEYLLAYGLAPIQSSGGEAEWSAEAITACRT